MDPSGSIADDKAPIYRAHRHVLELDGVRHQVRSSAFDLRRLSLHPLPILELSVYFAESQAPSPAISTRIPSCEGPRTKSVGAEIA